MPLPVDLNLITITGDYSDILGNGASGEVLIVLPIPLNDAVGKVVITAGTTVVPVENSRWSVTVPRCDNDVNPTLVALTIVEQVPGVNRSGSYLLTADLPNPVDITQLVPVNPAPPVSTVYAVLTQSNTYTGMLNDFTGSEVRVATPTNSADAATKAYVDGSGGGPPSGAAGGVLSGTYPNPGANAGTPGASAVGDTASVGTAASLALSDHRHGRESYGTPGSSAVGDTPAAGAATTNARSDHRHGREAFGSVTAQTSFGAASTTGTAVSPSHSDHAHGTPSLIDADAHKLGMVGEPFQIEGINHTDLGLSAGFLILALIRPGAGVVNNLGLFLAAAGVTASGVNQMALFDEAGVQQAVTGDMSAALANAANNGTYVEAPVTAPVTTLDATNYYVGVLCHFSGSDPKIGGIFNASSPVSLPTVKGHRPQIEVSGQAAMPGSINVSTASASPAAYWLAAS